ncbi:MAG: restriction endonuclease subunit S [Campylobacterota bacterium]|nr:restriction endonuclease subunit S [Campylobacterota bacterium]
MKIQQGYKQTKVGVIPEDWEIVKSQDALQRIRNKVDVQLNEHYQQIGIRSHGKGIFHKEAVTGEVLGNKSVFWIEPDCFVVNIVFAWEQAVGKTTDNEKGMIASHRFPMYQSKDNRVDIDYLLYFFKSKRGKHLLGLASPGGAGRNKTLGQNEFSKLNLPLPPLKEQQKIAQILSTWDSAIVKQSELIEQKKQLKRGLMQKLLSGEVRFDGFSEEWEEVKLGEILIEHKEKSNAQCEVHSVSVHKGIINQIEHLGRSFSASDISNYNLVKPYDIVYTKSPTGDFPYGIVKQNMNDYNAIVSPLYGVFTPKNKYLGYILHVYFESPIRTSNYLKSIIQKGAKNTINITNKTFLSKKLVLPINETEQQKIAEVLSLADREIALLKNELDTLKKQKGGLMQRLLMGEVRVKG